jgi:hypothetical protein
LSSGAVEVSESSISTTMPGVDQRGGDWNSFVFFSDPDGNSWVVQENLARS